MNDSEYIKRQEAVLCEKISKYGQVSISTKSFNDFVDTIFVTAIKTNECLKLHVNLEAKTLYFWNDCDEKFTQSIDDKGIDIVIDKLEKEFEQVYYFQTINGSQVLLCYIVKIDGIVDIEAIKKQVAIIQMNGNETFDCVKVHNFIGSKRYIVIFKDNSIIVQ